MTIVMPQQVQAPLVTPGRARPERTLTVPAMGGSLRLRVAHDQRPGGAAVANRDLTRVAARVGRWAARLTRFSDTSDLAALNARPDGTDTVVRPTLAAVLAWSEQALDLCPDLVDVTLLDERLAAEGDGIEAWGADAGERTHHPTSPVPPTPGNPARWHLVRRARGGTVVRRGVFRFDLDGVAKGWIADRALRSLGRYPGAMVDADGDIAFRFADGMAWHVAIADPDHDEGSLGVLRLDGRLPGGLVGVATSGTSVHRWPDAADGSPRHHLLDPRTRRPAETDVVQATVIMSTAREAEILAKAVVIAGSDAGMDLLDRRGVHGAVLLLESGDVVAPPQTEEWLA